MCLEYIAFRSRDRIEAARLTSENVSTNPTPEYSKAKRCSSNETIEDVGVILVDLLKLIRVPLYIDVDITWLSPHPSHAGLLDKNVAPSVALHESDQVLILTYFRDSALREEGELAKMPLNDYQARLRDVLVHIAIESVCFGMGVARFDWAIVLIPIPNKVQHP
jgi:hypothetical protein